MLFYLFQHFGGIRIRRFLRGCFLIFCFCLGELPGIVKPIGCGEQLAVLLFLFCQACQHYINFFYLLGRILFACFYFKGLTVIFSCVVIIIGSEACVGAGNQFLIFTFPSGDFVNGLYLPLRIRLIGPDGQGGSIQFPCLGIFLPFECPVGIRNGFIVKQPVVDLFLFFLYPCNFGKHSGIIGLNGQCCTVKLKCFWIELFGIRSVAVQHGCFER